MPESNLHAVRRGILLVTISIALAAAGAQPQQPSAATALFPVDDTLRDRAFHGYVQRLRSAVTARDTRALRRLVDTGDVVVGHDKDDKGWRRFVEKWRPDDREDRRLWTALGEMLAVGFLREHPRLYLSPYQVWRFPPGLDRAAHVVIARDKVVLRAGPSLDAAVVATLSFDIVRRLGDPVKRTGLAEWMPVRTLDGRSGFVMTRDVASPMAPRAQFGFDAGRWLMIALEDD